MIKHELFLAVSSFGKWWLVKIIRVVFDGG